MASDTVNETTAPGLTRRGFLRAAAATSAGWLASPLLAQALDGARPTSQPASQSTEPLWWLRGEPPRRIAQVRSTRVLAGEVPDVLALDHLVAQTVEILTDAVSAPRAWQAILGRARKIVIALEHDRLSGITTGDALTRVLVEQLDLAGYAPAGVTLLNASDTLARSLGTALPPAAWTGGIQVGEHLQQVAATVAEADAIINVPVLAVDPVAGYLGGMGSLARSVIRRPGHYYRAGAAAQLVDVLASEPVSARLRLTLLNGLRAIVGFEPDTGVLVRPLGSLIASQDPVAADVVGFELVLGARHASGIAGEPGKPILDAAIDARLGRYTVAETELVKSDVT